MVDVTDRLAVIIGGGSVAVRKARGLIDAGAGRIRMASFAALVYFASRVSRPIQQLTAGLSDLAGGNPEVVKRLVAQLAEWKLAAVAAKLPSDSNLEKTLSNQDLQRLRSLGYIK